LKHILENFIDEFTLVNLLPAGWTLQEADGSGKKKLICDIEAIHACTTGNFNTYSTEELRKAIPTWTTPYRKPILLNHDTSNGEPIGRILSAEMGYSEKAKKDCVIIRAEISDPEAMQRIRDGRYLTVSIGSRAAKVCCSICGKDWISEGYCDHETGELYDGKICTAILKGIMHNEASFVNVPADTDAQVVGIVSEGYLFGNHTLVKLSDLSTNLLEHQGGNEVLEALGIKEVEQVLGILEEAHKQLHAKFAAAAEAMGKNPKCQGCSGGKCEGCPCKECTKESCTKCSEASKSNAAFTNSACKSCVGGNCEKCSCEKCKESSCGKCDKCLGATDALLLKDAHAEIVRQMVVAKVEHAMIDALDEALPDDLQPTKEKTTDFGAFAELLANAKHDMDAVKDSLTTTTAECDTLKTQVVTLNEEKAVLQTTVDQLTTQATAAETELRKILAEQLVELTVPTPEDPALTLEAFMGKSKEVLQELLTQSRKQFVELYKVTDPTLHDETHEDNPPEVEAAKNAEAIKGLLLGSRATAIQKEVRL
jgi:outer membrane murein-binding lipoprotein Lpp